MHEIKALIAIVEKDADRNTPATFEEWRVEFNELATDVGDITNLPSTIGGKCHRCD